MKALAILALVSAVPAFANDVQSLKVQKTYDGKIAVCESDYNVNKAAYRPLISTLEATADTLKFTTAFVNLLCTKSARGFAWDLRLPLDPIPGSDLDGVPLFRTHSQIKYLIVNRGYEVVSESPATNASMQQHEFLVDLNKVLTRAELAALEQGKLVKASMEIFEQAVEAVHYKGQVTNEGQYAGGSYNINFTIRKTALGYQIVDFSFR